MLIRKADFNRDSDVVVYLRIPKTGSSSLSNMLAELFEEDRTAPLPDRQLDAWDYGLPRAHDQIRRWGMRRQDFLARALGFRRDRVGEAQFLHGHHPLWARLATFRKPLFITMTRDPVERFLSNYYMIRRKAERSGKSSLKHRVLREDPDLFATRIIRSPAAKRLNGMCLYLTRSGQFEDARLALETRLFAAARLDEIGSFSHLLADALGLPAPDMQHVNTGRNRPQSNPLSPKVEERLRAVLDPDRRLHDHIGEVGLRSGN